MSALQKRLAMLSAVVAVSAVIAVGLLWPLDEPSEFLFLAVQGALAVLLIGMASRFRELNRELRARREGAQQHLELQYHLVRAIASSSTLDEAFACIVESIGQSLGWAVGVFWVRDESHDRLRAASVWERSGVRLPKFVENTRNLELRAGEGLAGRVLRTGRAEWIPDLKEDPDGIRSQDGGLDGLRGALAFPVRTGEGTIGVLQFFSQLRREPDGSLLDLIEAMGAQLGVFYRLLQTREALAESGERYRLITESARDVIVTVDEDDRIVFVNQAAEEIFGYRPHELTGQPLHLLIPPALRARHAEGVRHYRATRERTVGWRDLETVGLHRSGREFPISISLGETERQDRLYLTGILRDVTERKIFETRLLEARDAALESARAKSSFVASLSHEVRTPLNGILGMSEVLAGTRLDDQQRHFVEAIRSSGQTLLSVVNELLDLSKIEAGRLRLETREFALDSTIGSVVAPLAERAHRSGVELAVHLHRDVPPRLCGDPTRLWQVLMNLLGNSVKFTRRGEIVLRVSRLSERNGEVLLHFHVRDTGIGFEPSQSEELFEPFRQLQGGAATPGGTGLGLAISRQIVQLMGGEIAGESPGPGCGATFWFTARFGLPTVTEPTVAPGELSGLRVLIVDDNATNREILVHQTSGWGMRVEEAVNASEAWEKLSAAVAARDEFRLLLTDMQMPGMDGLELARAVRGEPSFSSVRIILMTSVDTWTEAGIRQSLALDGSLVKPVTGPQLLTALLGVIGQPVRGAPSLAVDPEQDWEALSPAPAPPPILGDGDGIRILVADDSPINRLVLQKLLERLGLKSDLAENGHEVLAALARRNYDLVLMDCEMPGMDGYETTRRIRADGDGRAHTLILAVTAHSEEDGRRRCLEAGMDDSISKPLSMDRLAAALQEWLPRAVGLRMQRAAAQPLAFDPELLRDLASEVPVEDVIRRFVQNAREGCASLRTAALEGDMAAAGEAAGRLRAMAGAVGAGPMADLCARIENAAARRAVAEARLNSWLLQPELTRVEEALRNVQASVS